MSETCRMIQLFRERTSKEFLAASSLTPFQEEELANQLFEVFESVCTSTSYNEETETTLYDNTSDSEIDECEDVDELPDDPDYEQEEEEKQVFESFSLSYEPVHVSHDRTCSIEIVRSRSFYDIW